VKPLLQKMEAMSPMRESRKERRVRGDKKRATAPTVSVQIYDIVSQIAHLLNSRATLNASPFDRTGAKTIGEALIILGLRNPDVYWRISQYFVRDLVLRKQTIFGDENRQRYTRQKDGKPVERIRMNLAKPVDKRLEDIRHALGCPFGTAVGLVLEASIRTPGLVREVIERYAPKAELDSHRKARLMRLLEEIGVMDVLPPPKMRRKSSAAPKRKEPKPEPKRVDRKGPSRNVERSSSGPCKY
jgi:hypothetical protein